MKARTLLPENDVGEVASSARSVDWGHIVPREKEHVWIAAVRTTDTNTMAIIKHLQHVWISAAEDWHTSIYDLTKFVKLTTKDAEPVPWLLQAMFGWQGSNPKDVLIQGGIGLTPPLQLRCGERYLASP
jgi:hypothetical protein